MTSLPKIKIPGIIKWLIPFDEIPDPTFFLNPLNMLDNLNLLRKALFPEANETPEPEGQVKTETESGDSTYTVSGVTYDVATGLPINAPSNNTGTVRTATQSGTVTGGGSDFWTLAAIASLEDSDAQGRADVAQSIYNRAASGAYSSTNIRELIIGDKQYQPTWDYPRKNPAGEKANPEWLSIVDAQTAAAATGKSVAFVEQAARDIMNPTLQKNARDFVAGRTDFTNYSKPGKRRGEIYRTTGGKNNYFGWDWNYSGNVQGNVPDFNAVQTSAPATTGGITQTQQQQKEAEQRAETARLMEGDPRYTPPAQSTQPQIATAPQQPIPAISQSASYEDQAPIQVPMLLPSTAQRSPSLISQIGGSNLSGLALIDVVNSYYTAQLMANLYKQG